MSNYPLIQSILVKIMEAEARRLDKMIFDINAKNKELRSYSADGFQYNGDYYQPNRSNVVTGGYEAKNPLDKSLYDQMDMYLKDRDIVKRDMIAIGQIIYQLLKPLGRDVLTLHQMRDALPECVVSMVPEMAALPRQFDEAYTLKSNPRAMKQYEDMLPKIEVYCMSRLLF